MDHSLFYRALLYNCKLHLTCTCMIVTLTACVPRLVLYDSNPISPQGAYPLKIHSEILEQLSIVIEDKITGVLLGGFLRFLETPIDLV